MTIFWIGYGVALFLMVLNVLLRTQESGMKPLRAVVSAAGIGIGTLLIFLLLFKQAYWMALIPALLIVTAVLAGSSWVVMRNVLCAVLAATALAAGARALLPRLLVSRPSSAEQSAVVGPKGGGDVVKGQPSGGKTGETAVVCSAASPLQVAAGAPDKPVIPAPPQLTPPSEPTQNWAGAQAALEFGGSMVLEGNRRVAVVDHRTVETSNVVVRTHGPYVYRWRVTRITRHGIDLEPLDAVPVAP